MARIDNLLAEQSRAEQSRAEQSRAEQLANCDFVKVVLMALVVLYHSMAIYLPNGWFREPKIESQFFGVLAQWLNSLHVYGFTLVSGYIFAYLKFEKGKYTNTGKFIQNKIRRLIIPYFFASAVWVVPWYCYFNDCSALDIIKKYILGTSPSQLWFLLMLFWVFVISIFVVPFMQRNIKSGILIGIFLFAFASVGEHFIGNYFQFFTGCKYFVYFAIGAFLREAENERQWVELSRSQYCGPGLFLADVVLFALYIFLNGRSGSIYNVASIGIGLLLHIVGALTAFVILTNIAERIRYRECGLFRFYKRNSMTVYLFHQQVIYWTVSLLDGVVPTYILVLINFLTAILVSSVIAMALNKFRATRLLTGQKT